VAVHAPSPGVTDQPTNTLEGWVRTGTPVASAAVRGGVVSTGRGRQRTGGPSGTAVPLSSVYEGSTDVNIIESTRLLEEFCKDTDRISMRGHAVFDDDSDSAEFLDWVESDSDAAAKWLALKKQHNADDAGLISIALDGPFGCGYWD
jgi:hypothetical protein